MTIKELDAIQKCLPYGAQRAIAKKCRCGESYVSHVLAGRSYSYSVLEEAVRMAEIGKKNRDDKEKRLQQRIKKLMYGEQD